MVSRSTRPSMTTEAPAAEDLRALRRRLGLTQAQAAALALVSPRAWIKYESGERVIPAPTWALFRLRAGVITLADLDSTAT